MSRGSCLLLLSAVLFNAGCRASADDCREIAQHIVALAKAEAKLVPTSEAQFETTCNEQRPTRGLVQCMLGAQSLAELEAC
ncbi:hypothetical protein DB30_05200 [Enhygromyxa salina]|uniref:Secreted protein n=1 Tax=Enhygromyxa salina TaxID=215803 RepID=A0A0C1ZXK7_9BACT|nr:hypothetical protein [Enhygromyxa salina]KIG15893.1 hypothetical protein DB30_05200 [Enhygromyxa salina]